MSSEAARHHAAMAILAALGIAALVLGQPILVPLAVATIVAFILAPLVRMLSSRGVPHVLSVVLIMGLSLSMAVALALLLSVQLLALTTKVGDYKDNFIAKIHSVAALGRQDGALKRAASTFERLGNDISQEIQATSRTPAVGAAAAKSETVVVRDSGTQMKDTVRQVLSALENLATGGLALLFALFLLLQQNDMSDRIVRLLGTENLSDTSGAMTEAGSRLSKLFLTQALINASFGVVIGSGLWLIGLPGALVWGILAALSRFVPFIGALIAAVPPIILAAGVEPGWGHVIATSSLFLVCELIAAHFVEPLVLGRQVGLTPLAMVLAASFWTLLWGPVGLLLSAPLTMTFVVLGRYMAGLSFLSVLLGDEAPLTPSQELYRRLLSRDAVVAADQLEDAIEATSLPRVTDDIVLPALNLAATDEREGRLEPDQVALVNNSLAEITDLVEPLTRDPSAAHAECAVLVVPARGDVDAAMATFLARVITAATKRPTSVPPRLRGLSALSVSSAKVDGVPPEVIVVATAGGVPPRQLQLISDRAALRYPECRVLVITAHPDDVSDLGLEKSGNSRIRHSATAAELIANLRVPDAAEKDSSRDAAKVA